MNKDDDRLKAIIWECERVGLSYGKLVSQYTPDQLRQVYSEYEKYKAEKEKRRKLKQTEGQSTATSSKPIKPRSRSS